MTERAESYDSHLGRLLVLLRHFAPRRGRPLRSLTKLAKLDFLLRYPDFTDKLVTARNLAWPVEAAPTADERLAVESRMIRHKYGPWDDRYYPLLGALVGMGLVEVIEPGGTLQVSLTDEGQRVADQLSLLPAWQRFDSRADFLATHFDTSGNHLKDMIYNELPEVVDRAHRTVI